MGCKCSKEDELGDLDVNEEEYDYSENCEEYRDSPDQTKARSGCKINDQTPYGGNDTQENYESNYQKNNEGFQNLSKSQQFATSSNKDKELEYVFEHLSENPIGEGNNHKNQKSKINHGKTYTNDEEILNQSSQIPSMMSYEQSFATKKKKKKINYIPKYNTEVMKLFNIARNKPLSFCKHIDYCIGLITTNAEGQLVLGTDKTNKIGLKEGISKFNESKRFLLHIDCCNELSYDINLEIEISDNPELWLNNEYIKNKIIDKQSELLNLNTNTNTDNSSNTKKNEYSIFGFHFDYGMSDPIISSVLQIVDDNNCENRRRYNILNTEYKAVGITNKFSGNRFVSYFFFAG